MKKYISFIWLLSGIFIILSLSSQSCKETNDDITPEVPISDVVYESDYSFTLIRDNAKPVSDMLMGFNLIYPHEKKSIWQDGKIAGYLKDVNVKFLRYPGGTVVSFYHWDALTGDGWADRWNPEKPVNQKPSFEYMDIDEYMSLVKATGATPLVGINMSSGWRWDRHQEGLDEAIALMEYCKSKKFDVEYWYLDNEPYQHDSNGGEKTAEQYADLINAYVTVMKAFNPNIKIVVNWDAGYRHKRAGHEELIKRAGKNIDIIDIHWYWGWSDASWDKFLEATPMVHWTGSTYMEDIKYYKQMLKDLGFPNIEMASFEWNVGGTKPGDTLPASRAALAQAEMMMQFIYGGLDYAVFWPIHWPDQGSKRRSFVDTSTNSANPNYHLFKYLSRMQGGTTVEILFTKTIDNVFTIAVQDKDDKTLRICIMNKNPKHLATDIKLNQFKEMKFDNGKRYSVSPDGNSYKLDEIQLLKSEEPQVFKFAANSTSFTMLTFIKK